MSTDEDPDQNSDGNGKSGNGQPSTTDQGIEIFTVADDLGYGVYVSCKADVPPANLIEGVCNLLALITRAAIDRPQARRAGDLGLGEDVPW